MPARRTSVRARRCRGERPRFASRTPRGAKRRSTTARSRAASKPPDESFSHARSGPASARPPTSTRSGTERPGSSAKWRNTLARRAVRVCARRGSLLADVVGIVVHDHWKPYYTMPGVLHALCNAHHLRELKALVEIEKEDWARKMQQLLRRSPASTGLLSTRSGRACIHRLN